MIRQQLHTRFLLLVCAVVFSSTASFAQNDRSARDKALGFLQLHYADFGLTQQDVADTRITDEYVTKHNALTHVWVQQQYKGIPVFNGLVGLHVASDGAVYHVGHRFVRDLQHQANTTLPSLSASKALEIAMANLGFDGFSIPSLRSKINEHNWLFQGGAISKKDIPVAACYAVQKAGAARLAWTMIIEQANTADIWNIRVDAVTGLILDKINHTQYCTAGHFHRAGEQCEAVVAENVSAPPATPSALLMDESYNVFALPLESPSHGARSIVTNPHDISASPYGWLDTDGVVGADNTYTRGNNVWAFDDSANDDTPVAAESADAGASLNFDFPYNAALEPAENNLSAITNLFYMNNMMHDITHRYGFDAAAGNFQVNNYGGTGLGNDAVLAQALDGSGTNNANFSTPPDGSSGRMQMFGWTASVGSVVQVNAPGVISGTYFAGQSDWGSPITNIPLTAEVVFVNDGIEPTYGCEPPTNDVTGKIVMIDRGDCEFGTKALTIEQAGAVACIICDHEAPPLGGGMAPGNDGGLVTIPAIWMKKADCALLRQYAGNGLNISLVQPSVGSGPAAVDGDFDNGIIAHEYGHGISNRLTGGPSNTGCLGNPEQMGEGWSDFFALVTTVRPGDSGPTKRGVGTFVFRQPTDDNGIRRYPYSTDMSINPITFSTVGENPEVHALGEIWTAMTWDLYWAMVEKYGYDADINNLNSGNARAIQLVMDGMKLQPCSPGFQDGRDAIMLADMLNYNGDDTCLISSVFARRGLGYAADQKDPEIATDGVENFDPIPTCVKELKIKKITTTPTIVPGDNAEFAITVTNHKGVDVPNVVISDELPAGLTFVSASNGGFVSGGMVVWNIGTMQNGQVITVTYSAKSSVSEGSQSYFHDLMETDENWYSLTYNQDNIELFQLQNTDAHSGAAAWRANESATLETDFVLETIQTVTISGAKPILRFWHKYNTENSADPGFLEFYDNDAPNAVWKRVTNDVTFRNGYSGKVAYGAAYAFPNHYGFTGNSNGWVQSYFDMSAYAGKNISFHFRFGTDDNIAADGGGYWVVDEVEIMDMLNYNTEACVSSGSDQACDRADQGGVIVEPAAAVGANEPIAVQLPMLVQPNPVNDILYISIAQAINSPVQFSLISADGRIVMRKNSTGLAAGQVTSFDVQNLPAGLYMVQLESAAYRSISKVVIR
jgi:extracellular elastinolytic metalloproteinase